VRPAAHGGRWVEVAPERLQHWLDGFAERHGATDVAATATAVTFTAADGAVAECQVPFPPLTGSLVEHVLRGRRVAVLLVRRGGYAAGVFDGATLVASKVGSRHVQGRAAAGGWSQQRFARRRAGQARQANDAAADTAAAVLLPHVTTLDAFVAGGDRSSVDAVLADRRLAPLLPLLVERRIDVPDPRLRVLEATPAQFRAVRIRVLDGAGQPSAG
jgi:hypothetical protein